MSDDEPDYEKTQIYLAPRDGAAPRIPPGAQAAHEVLLKRSKEAPPATAAKVDFDITGAHGGDAPAGTARVDFDITGAGDAAPVKPAPAAAPRPAPAVAVPVETSSGGNGLLIIIGLVVAIAIAAYFFTR